MLNNRGFCFSFPISCSLRHPGSSTREHIAAGSWSCVLRDIYLPFAERKRGWQEGKLKGENLQLTWTSKIKSPTNCKKVYGFAFLRSLKELISFQSLSVRQKSKLWFQSSISVHCAFCCQWGSGLSLRCIHFFLPQVFLVLVLEHNSLTVLRNSVEIRDAQSSSVGGPRQNFLGEGKPPNFLFSLETLKRKRNDFLGQQ